MAMIKVSNYFLDLSFEYIMVLFIYLFILDVICFGWNERKEKKKRNLTFWKSCDWKWKSFCFWVCKYCDIIFFLFLFYIFILFLFWVIGVSKKKMIFKMYTCIWAQIKRHCFLSLKRIHIHIFKKCNPFYIFFWKELN